MRFVFSSASSSLKVLELQKLGSRIKVKEVDLLQNLSSHLIKANVSYFPITSPPALSSDEPQGTQNATGQYSYVNFFFQLWFSSYLSLKHSSFFCGFHSDSTRILFLEEKQRIKREHRRECHSAFESIFGKVPCMEGDFVVINFFALVHLLNNFLCTRIMIVSALSLSMTFDLHYVTTKTEVLIDGYYHVIRKT